MYMVECIEGNTGLLKLQALLSALYPSWRMVYRHKQRSLRLSQTKGKKNAGYLYSL